MPNNKEYEDVSISDFFKGKSIFITGGSGFIGKVLIEKLLRSCPNLESIYMLIRPKRNVDIEERIKHLTDVPENSVSGLTVHALYYFPNSPIISKESIEAALFKDLINKENDFFQTFNNIQLFDKLRHENKNFLDKIIPVNGNIKELKLGISEEDRKRIIDNVSIIINSAASVRFDDPLKDAVLTNVRSTREIMNLAQELKTIDAMVHISTLYANADNKVLEEKLYPRHDWQDVIGLVESCEESVLEVLSQKYIHPLPNTYTFTKSVAELVVDDFCKNKIPAVIIRPSIVIPTGCDPIEGWIDNYNGPVGLNVAGAKGIMKVVYCNPHARLDYVFVDNVVKSIIVATWKQSLDFRNQKTELLVCNVSTDVFLPMSTNYEYEGIILANPPETFIGCVSVKYTKCWYNFFLRVLIQHILRSLFIDALLAVSGNKLRLLKIQRRIYIANMAVLKFLMNEWKSKNNNYLSLDDAVMGINKKDFSFIRLSEEFGVDLMAFKFWKSAKLYLLKEKPIATESEVKKYRSFQLAGNILEYLFLGLILYLVTWTYRLPTKTYEMFYNYISELDS